ncbi:hypothetical protein CFAM422_009015 [Trichoderma lentiforme]|uniref:Uncharacterized protein n=1 Tax=Trichoderma lentiforme TaxID=1567552 RepID=A0A9P5C9J4_9HYPO|nr:hypothetical protein CFAM422_009015 [Trichoderma lentiforme]
MSSSCLEVLLELVPSGEIYSSLLSGGLTLAYNDEEINILVMSEKFLSNRIDNVKQKMKLYNHDPDLQIKSEELYMAVCNCILHCTQWLDEKGSAFFQQSRYGKDIKDSRQNMMKKAQEFEETIKICFMREKVPSEFQQEQIGLLMANQTFSACLHGLESTFVVLRDEKSLQSTDSLSTLSYLCGLIAHTLISPGLWPLTFFCGLHIVENAAFKGAQGLMRAIALQLMKVFGETVFSVPGVDLAMIGQKLAMEDLDVICSVFSMLLDSIPAGVVYLLIDGAHHYGTEMRTADMCAVMRFLNHLVERMRANHRGLVLKVIVTNPTSRQQHTWDFEAETVELERQLLAGGHRGINV